MTQGSIGLINASFRLTAISSCVYMKTSFSWQKRLVPLYTSILMASSFEHSSPHKVYHLEWTTFPFDFPRQESKSRFGWWNKWEKLSEETSLSSYVTTFWFCAFPKWIRAFRMGQPWNLGGLWRNKLESEKALTFSCGQLRRPYMRTCFHRGT